MGNALRPTKGARSGSEQDGAAGDVLVGSEACFPRDYSGCRPASCHRSGHPSCSDRYPSFDGAKLRAIPTGGGPTAGKGPIMHSALNRNLYVVKEYVGMFKAASNFGIFDAETGEEILHCRED